MHRKKMVTPGADSIARWRSSGEQSESVKHCEVIILSGSLLIGSGPRTGEQTGEQNED